MTTTVLAYIPSPAQGVWHVAGVPLRAYALFIIVGIIAALVLGDRRWVARGGEPGVVYDVALWAVPFGLIGGRLYHVITDWRTYFGDDGAGLAAAFRIWDGGLGIWGAVALGGIGAWIACRRRGIPLPAFGDAVAPGIILAQAIGRLGNYFNQELYGRVTTLPWGLEIYVRENAAGVPDMLNGVSTGELIKVVHPTFLYELLWNLLVFAALILIDRRFRIGHGRLFAIYVAGYCVGRFWIELMRSDTATLLAGVRINSFTATFVFIGAVVYVMAAPKGREDPATLKGDQDAEADEDSDLEEFVTDLAVAASTTGVVAAAKVAGEDDEKSVVEVAEAEALSADVEAEPEESGEPLIEPGGLGSVEGDEVVEATEGASAAHDAAVEGVSEAKALAADVDAEEDVEPEAKVPAEPVTEVDEAEPDAGADTVTDTSGLGSVEGDEVVEATEGASVVHDAAVEGEAEAEVLADEAEAEPDEDAVAAEESGESGGPETEAGGLGSVEGDEVAEAAEDAPETHEVAVEGEAEAEALAVEGEADEAESDEPAAQASESDAEAVDVEAEPTDEPVTEAGGLGSVEGDEVAEAAEDAPEAHEVAVEGEAEAEALAAEVEAESDSEPADEAETSVAEESEVEPTEDSVTEVPESDASGDEDGAESVEDEPDAQVVAAEGASVVEALGAEDAESEGDDGTEVVEADEDSGADESVSEQPVEDEPDAQVVAAEGASVAEALDAEVETEEAESEGDTEPEVEPDSVDDADASAATVAPASAESSYRSGVSETGGRVRQWLRGRRSR